MGIRAVIGKNSLWDVRPDVAILLTSPEDGYRYTEHSNQRASFTCPICKAVYEKTINDVSTYGFSCGKCSDKISYPEKFMRSLLVQLGLSFKYQVSKFTPGFEWIKDNRRYDFYVETDATKIFIEMDGGIGHGHYMFGGNIQDVAGLEIDKEKDFMAKEHGIDVVRIDCYYRHNDRFLYIKNNVLNSALAQLFDLSVVNWNDCGKYAQGNLVTQAVELFNSGVSVRGITTKMGYCDKTIRRWLKQASNIGLCDFGTHEARSRSNRSKEVSGVAVNKYTKDNVYICTYESMADAERDTGIAKSNIVRVCDKKLKSAGGYKWYRAFDLLQPDKTKIVIKSEVVSA